MSLAQVGSIILPDDLPILKMVTPPKSPKSPQGKDREGLGTMSRLEIMKRVHKYRYDLFDKVCDYLKKTPKQLQLMRIEDVALAFVEVTKKLGNPLPIEKFEPTKLRQRIAEYVEAKG